MPVVNLERGEKQPMQLLALLLMGLDCFLWVRTEVLRILLEP